MRKQKYESIQDWLPFNKILDDGIVKLKDNKLIKIMRVIPINFNLKSELEKEAILNSYKIFLKTCNFDIQILIQSKKEDLSNNYKLIREDEKRENANFINIQESYITYVKELNISKKSSNKNFYIVILGKDNLNEDYYKIKECLARSGNIVYELNRKEVEELYKEYLQRKTI